MRFGAFLGALFLSAVISFIAARIVVLDSEYTQAVETHKAVCLFRAGLYDSARQTEKYAQDHPEGIPSLHFTQRQLFDQAKKERANADTLRGLRCVPDGR